MLAQKRWIVPTVLVLSAGLAGCQTGGKLPCRQTKCGAAPCASQSCGRTAAPKGGCLAGIFGKRSCINQGCRSKSSTPCATGYRTGCAAVSQPAMMPGHPVAPRQPTVPHPQAANPYYAPQVAPRPTAPAINVQPPMPPIETEPMPAPAIAPPLPKASLDEQFLAPPAPPEEIDATAQRANPLMTVSQSRRIGEPSRVVSANRQGAARTAERQAPQSSNPQSYSRAWADALGLPAKNSYQPDDYQR